MAATPHKGTAARAAQAVLVLSIFALPGERAVAQDFIGLDPYNRPIYAFGNPPTYAAGRHATSERGIVHGPVFQSRPGRIGGPLVAGPLYYAEPRAAHRPLPYSASRAGAVLGFDADRTLAQARGPQARSREWYASCSARYRSFDARSGTFQPYHGPRQPCR